MTEQKAATATETQQQPPAGEPAKTTFTSEEVERMKANWSENISRHEEKANKAAKELESVKAKLAKDAEERRLAEMSEVERAKADAEAARKEAAQIREQYRAANINTEVRLIGMREGALDAADLLAFISREGIEIGEDGGVKGVEEAVKALKDKKPYLFKSASNEQGKPAGQHPPNSATPRKDGPAIPDAAALTAERVRRNLVARGMAQPV